MDIAEHFRFVLVLKYHITFYYLVLSTVYKVWNTKDIVLANSYFSLIFIKF